MEIKNKSILTIIILVICHLFVSFSASANRHQFIRI
ncbi:MAG: hypothetical protein ACI9E5_001381, partial [Candidatus Omnitrophota bacterium]